MTAGEQLRGSLKSSDDVIYYAIKASLSENKSNSVLINLSPLKGNYDIFSSRKGVVPTREKCNLFSTNNHLELSYEDYNKNEEHIIGIQLSKTSKKLEGNFQFFISLTYTEKPLKLKPGVLSSYHLQKTNLFMIEIHAEMKDILIIRSITDGHNLRLCVNFIDNVDSFSCYRSIDERNVSLYLNKK